MIGLTLVSPESVAADVRIKFVNGRELIVSQHWFVGTQTWFTSGRGTVGVPRDFVAAIEAVDSGRPIGGSEKPVNAPSLVAPESIR
jgi:hypothetical protein